MHNEYKVITGIMNVGNGIIPGGGHSLSEVTGMCLLQVKSRGLSGKMCTLQNMGSISKQPE